MGRRRKINHDLPERVYRKHGGVYFVDHRNKWHRLGLEWDSAAKEKWVKLSTPGQTIKGSMAEVMERYMEEIAPKKASKSFEDNQKQIEPLMSVFGKMLPQAIKPQHVYAYLDLRGKKSPTGANLEKALLSHIFTIAIRWGIVETNPCRDVRKIPVPKRDRYISNDEFRQVKNFSNKTISLLMDFAFLTGQRIGDLLKVRLEDLHEDGIYFVQSKGGKSVRLLIVWNDDLRSVVSQIRALDDKESLFLFHGRGGKPYTYCGISSMFRRAVIKSGIKDFHFHDIRAKSLTDLDRSGGKAQQLAGHKSPEMTQHYIKRRVVERVEGVHFEQDE
ncbi:MAG: tyrosine-type recombinase/integrase [Magnetococcales bacterium]|nr:tyrosine-type recombinase/integrase [Magnetococcales bacterium]